MLFTRTGHPEWRSCKSYPTGMSEQSVVVVVETGHCCCWDGGSWWEAVYLGWWANVVFQLALCLITILSQPCVSKNMAAANHCSRPNLRLSAALYWTLFLRRQLITMKLHIYLSKGKCKIGVLTLIVLHHHPVVSISSIVRTDPRWPCCQLRSVYYPLTGLLVVTLSMQRLCGENPDISPA